MYVCVDLADIIMVLVSVRAPTTLKLKLLHKVGVVPWQAKRGHRLNRGLRAPPLQRGIALAEGGRGREVCVGGGGGEGGSLRALKAVYTSKHIRH